MNYTRAYDWLIARAKLNGAGSYFEIHHIVPRCLGGSDHHSNLVDLTAREHFLAHLLLAKIHGGKLWHAANWMRLRTKNSRLYEIARRGHVKAIAELNTGVSRSPETRAKLSIAALNAHARPEVKAKMPDAIKRGLATPESKARRSVKQREVQSSPEINARRSDALRKYHAQRKAGLLLEKAHFEALWYYRRAA